MQLQELERQVELALKPDSAPTYVDHIMLGSIRAAASQHERQLAQLESELGGLLPPQAGFKRGAATLEVETDTPDELLEILERISRQRRAARTGSALRECSWTACLGADALSVSGTCGGATVKISSSGAFALSLEAGGHEASVALSPSGVKVRHAQDQ